MELKFPNVHRRRISWQKWAMGALLALGVASAALYLFRDARNTFFSGSQYQAIQKGSLRVNINTATTEELESIPDIGPARAAQIIANRPYSRLEDLEHVHGLGHSLVQSLRPYVKFSGATEIIAR
jgi:competence ComEA-like helix-hairpin-helix protein